MTSPSLMTMQGVEGRQWAGMAGMSGEDPVAFGFSHSPPWCQQLYWHYLPWNLFAYSIAGIIGTRVSLCSVMVVGRTIMLYKEEKVLLQQLTTIFLNFIC